MRMLWKAKLLGLVLVLAACTGPLDVFGTTPPTAPQALYATDGAYEGALRIAVGYRNKCFAKPRALRTQCRQVVERLQELDNEYAAIRDRVGEGGKVELLTAALERLEQYLIVQAVGESVQ